MVPSGNRGKRFVRFLKEWKKVPNKKNTTELFVSLKAKLLWDAVWIHISKEWRNNELMKQTNKLAS